VLDSKCTRRDVRKAPKASHRWLPPALSQRHIVQAEIPQIHGIPGFVNTYCVLVRECQSKHWYSYNAVVCGPYGSQRQKVAATVQYFQRGESRSQSRSRKSSHENVREENIKSCDSVPLMNSLRLWFQATAELMPPPKHVTNSFHPLNQVFLPSTQKSAKASVEFNAGKREQTYL
jgi:hypothetical protein